MSNGCSRADALRARGAVIQIHKTLASPNAYPGPETSVGEVKRGYGKLVEVSEAAAARHKSFSAEICWAEPKDNRYSIAASSVYSRAPDADKPMRGTRDMSRMFGIPSSPYAEPQTAKASRPSRSTRTNSGLPAPEYGVPF